MAKMIAVIKIGTTTSTLWAGSSLSSPDVRQHVVANLMDSNRIRALDQSLRQLRSYLPNSSVKPLVAGAEAFRLFPELSEAVRGMDWSVWVLSPEEEGRLSYAAVKARHPETEVVVDIGGGSTELVTAQDVWSLPVGAARHNQDGTLLAPGQLPSRVIWIGGTAVLANALLNGPRVGIAGIEDLLHNHERWAMLDEARRPLFGQGLTVMHELMDLYGWQEVSTSSRGLTEGLWLAACLGRVRSR